MSYVYTLELEDGKFYVGFTEDLCTRIAQHFLGRGALWTREHKPIRVLSVAPGPKELEDPTTIALMAQKGWRNVRGGAWTSIELGPMPRPLCKAFSIQPPRDSTKPEGPRSFDFQNLAVEVVQGERGWEARVSGALAALASPEKCLKSFRAQNREEAIMKAEAWIGAGQVGNQWSEVEDSEEETRKEDE